MLVLPEAVRRRAASEGERGFAWVAGLPRLVADLERDWGLTVGEALDGGTESFVALVALAEGGTAVLKLAIPGATAPARAMHTLRQARGRGYARLLRHDETGEAMLLERLGPRLSALGWSVERQIEAICGALDVAWAMPVDASPFPSGAAKADELAASILSLHREMPGAASDQVVHRALDYCERRRRAFDPARALLAHGDAHANNTLAVAGCSGAFKFVDPEGLFIEPEYDLAISMREWSEDLLEGDPVRRGLARCRRLAARTGLDEEVIWQWGTIERLANGLLLSKHGMPEWAKPCLAVSEAWAKA
jgi:streptomycin 6-kinase